MIAVFGATGKVGGAAAFELRRRGLDVRAVVRDAARSGPLAQIGCEIAVADLHDGAAVARAIRGASGLLVICPLRPDAGDVEADAQRTIEVIGAAIESEAPRAVVAISDYGAHHAADTGLTMIFRRLEERLRGAPAAMTFLRSAEQMENWSRQVHAARARGVLPSLHHPIERLFPLVSARDVGLVAADILSSAPRPRGAPRVVHVEGPRRYSAIEIAGAVGQILDLAVVALPLERSMWTSALGKGGLGASYARLVVALQEAHNAGRIDVEPGADDVRRGATDLPEALRRAIAPGASS